eukprot:m.338461 g.338461  ORF g.338461 m.338461 type:complete len:412 (-) comp16084_c1_seq1:369-1604(-)
MKYMPLWKLRPVENQLIIKKLSHLLRFTWFNFESETKDMAYSSASYHMDARSTAVWRRTDNGTQVYAHKGHLHLGSEALPSAPLSNPDAKADRITTGVPAPLRDASIIDRAPARQTPSKGKKNIVSKQHSVHTSIGPGSASALPPRPLSEPGPVSALAYHYRMWGRSSYRSQFRKPKFQGFKAASSSTCQEQQQRAPSPFEPSREELGHEADILVIDDTAVEDGLGSGVDDCTAERGDRGEGEAMQEPVVGHAGDGALNTIEGEHQEGDTSDSESDDEESLSVTRQDKKEMKSMLAITKLPPVQGAQRPPFRRSLSDDVIRFTRKHPNPEHTAPPPPVEAAPFSRPYVATADGERPRPPTKTEMIRKILHAHPSPQVNVGRSLYHYDPQLHGIRGTRQTTTPYDAYNASWK